MDISLVGSSPTLPHSFWKRFSCDPARRQLNFLLSGLFHQKLGHKKSLQFFFGGEVTWKVLTKHRLHTCRVLHLSALKWLQHSDFSSWWLHPCYDMSLFIRNHWHQPSANRFIHLALQLCKRMTQTRVSPARTAIRLDRIWPQPKMPGNRLPPADCGSTASLTEPSSRLESRSSGASARQQPKHLNTSTDMTCTQYISYQLYCLQGPHFLWWVENSKSTQTRSKQLSFA